jgi:hypothetical protein
MTLATDQARRQARAQHADDPFIVLLTIDHDDLPADLKPLRIARNREAVVSRGHTFIAYPFAIEEPGDGDEQPKAAISIGNVSRRIGKAIEAIQTPPTCLIEIVLASDPDTVERSWEEFTFTEVSWDAFQMRAVLEHVEYWDEPWPYKRATERRLPGLFP